MVSIENQKFTKEFLAEQAELCLPELIEKYGEEALQESKDYLNSLTEDELQELFEEQDRNFAILASMKRAGEGPQSDVVQEMVARHLQFLKKFGEHYNIPAFRALGKTYSSDERYTEYLNGFDSHMASWLDQAIQLYCDAWEHELDDTEFVKPGPRPQHL